MRTRLLHGESPEAVAEAARILRAGGLVAFPTETVYGLGADGFNAEAVRRIFAAKGRPADNPLILHVSGTAMASLVAEALPEVGRALAARFWPGPLTLVLPRREAVPAVVTAGLPTVAVRCPAHPIALALIEAVGRPLAAPSANRSGRPSPTTAEDVLEDLEGRIDAVLDGGPTGLGVESTVVDVTVSPPVVLRPGGVTLEALRAVAPDAVLHPAVRGRGDRAGAGGEGVPDEVPRSPGMKHVHYAPRAELILFDGPAEAAASAAAARALGFLARGRRVGVLATDETLECYRQAQERGAVVVSMGSRARLEGVAASLFHLLRWLDRQGVSVIVAEGVQREGLGLAIMDRLTRAAREVWVAG